MAGITHIAISINIQRPDEKKCPVLYYEMEERERGKKNPKQPKLPTTQTKNIPTHQNK